MTSAKSATKPNEMEADDIISRSPGAVRSRAEGASIVQVDLGLGKNAVLLLWLSSLISGIAIAGLVAACFFIYKNIGYTAVLEYDLMDLRAKVGQSHENLYDEPHLEGEGPVNQ